MSVISAIWFRTAFIIVAFIAIAVPGKGQDRLLRTDGTMLKGKVLATYGSQVKFVAEGQPIKNYRMFPAAQIQEIYFGNGKRLYFNTSEKKFVEKQNKPTSTGSGTPNADKTSTGVRKKIAGSNNKSGDRQGKAGETKNVKGKLANKYADDARFNFIKINVVPLLFNSYALFYEHMPAPGYGLSIGINYADLRNSSYYPGQQWITFTPEFRLYAPEHRNVELSGLYAAPYLKFRQIRSHVTQATGNTLMAESNSYGAGATLGKQFVFKNKYALDVFVGMTLYAYQSVTPGLTEPERKKITAEYQDYRVGIAIGYGF